MTESNATQVILTDDGLKIIKAQSTADNAVGGVTNLNDPNLMNVIEKQTQASQYAGLTSQYNVVLARAKEANVSTTALTTAYTNLNNFMTAVLADTTVASDVDRDTYKSLTDAYNVALSNVQTDLSNSFNTDISNMQSSVSVASQAASSAVIVASQAAITGDNASHVASQAYSVATVAQSAGNNATSVANNASQAASNAILAGSQAAVKADKASTAASQAQIAGDNATSVANNATSIANSATSTADNALSQAQAVGSQASAEIQNNSAATAKAQSTADNAFSQATTAIDNGKVTSQAVTDLKDGSTMTIAELQNGLATKVANSDYASYKEQTASQIGQLVTNGAFSAYKTQTADLIASKVATKDFSAYQATTAKSIESKVESSDFNTYKTQTADLISSKVSNIDFNNLGGGRNYLLNSKLITITPTGQANYDYRMYLSDDFWKNPDRLIADNIKVSFTMRVQNALSTEFNSNVYFGNSPWYRNSISYPAGTTKLQKYKLSYSITDSTYTADNLFIRFQDTNTADNPFIIENVTLSIGSNFVDWSPAPEDQATQSDITQSINNINLGFKNPDGSTFQMNLSADGVALMDFSKIMLNGTTNITNGTIGTAQIVDAAITNAKIGKLAVGTAQIANGAITNAQIGNAAVDTANIKDAAISSAKIASLAVGTAQIGNGAITNAKIGKLAVGTAQIANAAITDAQVGNVSANKLTAGTIDFNTITGKNINASNITTGTLSTDRLNVGTLSALSADLGNVTAGSLKGVNIVAKTFSTPNGSFTTDASGAITAKNMTLTGGTLTSPTINASTINGSTINGTTFNAGTKLNSYGNTSYPLTINQDGSVTSTSFGNIANDPAALRTVIKDGSVKTNFRGMNQISTSVYPAADVALGAGQLALLEGYSTSQDPNFTATGMKTTGYSILDASTGLSLHGDNQQITFNGTSDDVTPKGIIITPYGNINPNGTQNVWYVGNNMSMKTASFGMDADQNVPISLSRQTLVDEIGAMGNRLDNGRLLLHAVDGNAQMYLLNDGSPAFVSPTIYNRTYSNGANMFVTSSGRVGRSTSASKYKLAITRNDDTTQADRLMTLNPASWNDKVATEKMAESLSNGEITVESEINLKRHYGLIAEDLRDAGLDEFLITGDNGQIEGIEYDRLWTVLIPKIKQLNNRVNELERKTL